jgi:hypothetical protein
MIANLLDPDTWGPGELIAFAVLCILAIDRLLDLSGRLPSTRRSREEAAHMAAVNEEYRNEITELRGIIDAQQHQIEDLKHQIEILRLTDSSALITLMREHDQRVEGVVPEIIGALHEVRNSLHALTLSIREARPIEG